MNLLDQINQDILRITTDTDEFAVNMTFTDKGYVVKVVRGIFTKHHTQIDASTGAPVNSRTCSIGVSELELNSVGYPVRDPASGKVDMAGHLVTFKDSTQTDITYSIREHFPDETLGLIVFILDLYAKNN